MEGFAGRSPASLCLLAGDVYFSHVLMVVSVRFVPLQRGSDLLEAALRLTAIGSCSFILAYIDFFLPEGIFSLKVGDTHWDFSFY